MNYNTYFIKHNNYTWTAHQYSSDEWPKGIAIFCPASSKNQKYADSLIAMCYMSMDDVEKWKDSYRNFPSERNERDKEYEEFKEGKSNKIIALLEEKIPGITESIEGYEASTPLTMRDYIGTKDGSLYGIMKDYQSPLKTFLHPRTKIPNLYLTGQNLNVHGVVGVALSSLVTTNCILDISEEISEMNRIK